MFRMIGSLLLFSIFALTLVQAAESVSIVPSVEHDIVNIADDNSNPDAAEETLLHCVHCHAGHYKVPTQTSSIYHCVHDNQNPLLGAGDPYKSPLFDIVRPPRG